jgi:hypothetical protein
VRAARRGIARYRIWRGREDAPMASDDLYAAERRPAATAHGPLRELTSRQIAVMIRGLDSRLAGIDYDGSASEPVLVYRFDVAGRQEAFAVAAVAGSLMSISDLYPEADAYERALQQRFGLRFRPPGADPGP